MRAIHDNLQAVRQRIIRAAVAAGRDPLSVTLLAVSKTQPPACIEEALGAGQRAFGENYVQEAVEKMDALAGRSAQWHLIGPLQSNKTRLAAERFDWVHTVESGKIARRLSDQRPADRPPLNILIQVNVSGEASKSGVSSAGVSGLADEISSLSRLCLRGLMAIPAPATDSERQKAGYRRVREAFENLKSRKFELDTLSMGMSDDMEAAIGEGATMVRIGTAIFGRRQKAPAE
ncbi:MAG: YggS family pyridoxal phosphate-dependent enzyme [Candidatus Parcubacteria bacterium]|nr:YggS family pyridoxal phosphate-dependent enzyme [Burkholderiales bacterium]